MVQAKEKQSMAKRGKRREKNGGRPSVRGTAGERQPRPAPSPGSLPAPPSFPKCDEGSALGAGE